MKQKKEENVPCNSCSIEQFELCFIGGARCHEWADWVKRDGKNVVVEQLTFANAGDNTK